MTEPFVLHRGDCLEVLRTLPDNSVDSIVTDPPYGLSKEPDMAEVLRHWLAGDDYKHTGGGFMGKSWDSFVPGPSVWREALRVLKPGGHLLAFFGSRTYDMGTLAIRLAGFEIRDQIQWLYGSGFPKSLDVSKAIDKAAGAERWAGWGTALKPAHEPICVARKPLVGTVAANVMKHGTGALNIDGCRVPTAEGDEVSNHGRKPTSNGWDPRMSGAQMAGKTEGQKLGRWPANVIHDGSPEVLEAFNAFHGDTGTAARFFYCAKASKADRNEGLDGFERQNTHPTVKPTELMAYLCRLVTPLGGVVLDPYMGSGSTGKAAMREGFRFIGIERDEDENGQPLGYMDIARARIEHALAKVRAASRLQSRDRLESVP